jgi:HAD superfamily hydrolase (TIGR01509 family)
LLSGVVFDFDGLIVDTEWPVYEGVATVFAAHGLDYGPERWVHAIGSSWDVDWPGELAVRLGRPIDPVEVRAAARAHRELLLADAAPLPGVTALLDELEAAGVAVAVASSSPRSWVGPRLEALGLAHRFAVVRTLDDVAAAKPAPDLFLAACAALGARPATAVALEDSAHGATAAKAAGMRCVAVPNRLTRHLDLSHADLVVPSLARVGLAELVALVGAG